MYSSEKYTGVARSQPAARWSAELTTTSAASSGAIPTRASGTATVELDERTAMATRALSAEGGAIP